MRITYKSWYAQVNLHSLGELTYYQILTVHGVLLGLILTTYFIIGFQIAAISRTAGTFTDKQRSLGWIGFWIMTAGTLLAATMVLLNEASVLYTFYAPLTSTLDFLRRYGISSCWILDSGYCYKL